MMDPIPSSGTGAAGTEIREDSEENGISKLPQNQVQQGGSGSEEHLEKNSLEKMLPTTADEDEDPSDAEKREKDEQQLLKIFPEEVWSLILDELKDLADLESACNASLFFRQILLSKRVLFLFPKVWEILDFKYHQDFPIDINYQSPPEIDGVPYKSCDSCYRWNPRWWYTSTLKLRGVCWTWSQVVDNSLQGLPTQWNVTKHHGEERVCTTRNTYFHIMDGHNPEVADDFLKHFKTTHPHSGERSPFVGRNLWLSLDSEDDDDNDGQEFPPVSDHILGLLEAYGRHVWHCELGDVSPLMKCYSALVTVLRLLPNLKTLTFDYNRRLDHDTEELEELEMEISVNPIPTLVSLNVISMIKPPRPIMNELVRTNSQVSVLEIRPDFDDEDYCKIKSIPLPNLRQLGIRYGKAFYSRSLQWAPNTWPLNKMELDLGNAEFIKWSLILSGLGRFAGTLTSLMLKLPQPKNEQDRIRILEESSTLKLWLPRVVYFKVEMKTVSSLDFILPMRESLEILEVTMVYDVTNRQKTKIFADLESGQVIKWLSVSDRKSESNVWTLFPKLKKFTYGEACRKDDIKDGDDTFATYLRPK